MRAPHGFSSWNTPQKVRHPLGHSLGALVLTFACLGASACGAGQPRESDVFHDPALRASVVEPANDEERGLLDQLANDPAAGALRVGASTYTPRIDVRPRPSGHSCRVISERGFAATRVRDGRRRVAVRPRARRRRLMRRFLAGLRVQARVVYALSVRETRTRYGPASRGLSLGARRADVLHPLVLRNVLGGWTHNPGGNGGHPVPRPRGFSPTRSRPRPWTA